MAIDPRRSDLERFAAEPDAGPIVMLNLLRFAPGGRARYEAYLVAATPFVRGVGGEVVYAGEGGAPLVGEAGETWDAVLLVRYPSRAAFLQMIRDPAYQEITALRTAALDTAVLQPTTTWPISG